MMKTFIFSWMIVAPLLLMQKGMAQDKSKGRPSPQMTFDTMVGNAKIRIVYGAPSVRGREIWGKLVPLDEIWRTGANEATTFETSEDLKIQGSLLPKGKYAFFTIPGKEEWVLIFHKKANQWGTYGYKPSEDALRVKVKPLSTDVLTEQMSFVSVGGGIALLWEKLRIEFSVGQ